MKSFGKDLLRKIKDAQLEGENAHGVYSPPRRPNFSYEEILSRNPRFAAVNILLYLKEGAWYFPLMLRSQNENDRHSGQVSLPGGKYEDGDKNFLHTAKRETSEEFGIEEYYIRVIREITPIYIPPSNFYVHAFISYTKKNPAFHLQEGEADALIEFPISTILSLSQNPEMKVLPTSRGVEVPVIKFGGYHIWGATAMILSEFSNLLKKL